MNHYERIVSYIHQYQGGVKGANVGYAKIERRGEDCRIQVQLRNGHLSRNPEIYLFRQLEGGIQAVSMGEMSLSGGEICYKENTEVDQLFGSNLSLEDVDGLLIYISRDYYFATSWKNDSIDLGNWPLERGSGTESISENTIDAVTGEGKEVSTAEEFGGETEIIEENGEELSQASRQEISEEKREKGEEQKTFSAEKIGAVQTEGGEAMQESGAKMRRESREVIGEERGREAREPGKEMNSKEEEQGLEAAEASQVQMQAICGVCPFKRQNMDYGKRILLSFPTMRPFPEERGSECVRLELQDIGCLPMKYWSLSGNRFLLHGYYCYRHLIFCQRGQGKYVLGVPGIYSDREQKNALRFGFHSFQSIGEFGKQQGAFGYWLMELM